MLGQFFLSACLYIHCSCIEVEFYEILLVPITYFLDFGFQDFRRSVRDFATICDPLICATCMDLDMDCFNKGTAR